MIGPNARPSRYLRPDPRNLAVRRWAARALMAADLEAVFTWGSLDKATLVLFERFDLNPEAGHLDDVPVIRRWLTRQLDGAGDEPLDETDPFAVNTRRIARDLGLDTTSLHLLRFALLMGQNVAMRKSMEPLGDTLTLVDAVDALVEILELEPRAVRLALRPDAPLRRTGVLPMPNLYRNTGDLDDWTMASPALLGQVFEPHADGFSIEERLFGSPPRSKLARRDFAHLGGRLDTLVDYLRHACRDRATGANVLLHGPPGTGKTELARWIARAARRPAVEIAVVDDHGQSRGAADRLDAWRLCQGIVPAGSPRIVLFDEAEEILSDEGFACHGFRKSHQFGKGFLNGLLETNPLPTVWITNTLSGVDDAYLRRFDMTLHMASPDRAARARIARHAFRDLPIEPPLIEAIAARTRLTPAHVEKASKVCRIVGAGDAARVELVARHVLDEDLRAVSEKPLARPTERKGPPTLLVDPGVLNTDIDPEHLLGSLASSGYGRLCFHGPPGTGKTAFAAEIAHRLSRPLHVTQAADILGPYVGMTERNVAKAFTEAEREGAVLLLDEADSFLQDRRRAERHWQVTEVNQFLTSLERHEGYVVCTTNLVEELDPAALRRFDFKVRFGCMDETQASRMVEAVLRALGRGRTRTSEAELARLAGAELVPGDFAVALRQGAMDAKRASARTVVDAVLAEVRMRTPVKRRPMGFS